jgi:hypothetical protein
MIDFNMLISGSAGVARACADSGLEQSIDGEGDMPKPPKENQCGTKKAKKHIQTVNAIQAQTPRRENAKKRSGFISRPHAFHCYQWGNHSKLKVSGVSLC